MSNPAPLTVTYELDGDDFITSVSSSWNAFALGNGGSQVTAPHVVGTLLWHHVTGDNLRHVLRILYQRARSTRQPLVVDFVCNSPTLRRNMRLELLSTDGRSLRADSVLVAESPLSLAGGLPAGESQLRMCSWCNRFEVEGVWREFEDTLGARQLLIAPEVPDISHTMCSDCYRKLDPDH